MQKALVTFVVLAVIMVIFFVVIEYTGEDPDDVAIGTAQKVESAENGAVSFHLDGEVEQLSFLAPHPLIRKGRDAAVS